LTFIDAANLMQSPSAHSRLLRHLVRPARGGAAGVVLVFSLLFFIAAKAGLIGIPLAVVLTSWFFKYAYILMDHTARGFDDPPTLDINMLNPFDEQRPLAQLLILALIYIAVKFTATYVGVIPAVIVALASGFCLPASIAVLGLESNLLRAAYPVAWIHMIRGLGLLYVLILVVIAAYAIGLSALGRIDLWFPIEAAVGMFAVLSIFSFLGGAIYERRHELGVETWVSPERREDLEKKDELRRSDNLVMEAYGLMRADSHTQSWQKLTDWLASRGNSTEDYRWLSERLQSWDDARYITRLTEERLDRLLTLKRSGEALDVVAQRLVVDPGFRPKSAAHTWAIAQIAARGGGKPGVARILLADFAARFPGDPHVAAAGTLAKQLGAPAP
jgi:hypothetical protein